jgi:hypothetical protein
MGPTSESYHVFLHLLDEAGLLISQSDGVPAGWARPTTGWLSGEYVTDVRVLQVPSDLSSRTVTLSAGMYIPAEQRLLTPDGSDSIQLTSIPVEGE